MAIKCLTCGREIEFKEGQNKTHCTRCGSLIISKQPSLNKTKIPKCFICFDRGFVTFNVQMNNLAYEVFASCICEKSEAFSYWPKITEALGAPNHKFIEEKNRREFMIRLKEREINKNVAEG